MFLRHTINKGFDMIKFLKDLDFKTIILEIKGSRKGVALIIFIACLFCAIFDYLLRKNGIVLDWLIQFYFPIGMISICVWAIKVFNKIADKIDAKKDEEIKQKEYNEKITAYYEMLEPVLADVDEFSLAILKKFIEKERLIVSYYPAPRFFDKISSINRIFSATGSQIKIVATYPSLIVSIDQVFYDVIKKHFLLLELNK
jgi:phage-related holin